MDNVILFPCADVCVMFSLCLLHSCFWAAVDLLSSLWEQLTSTTTSRGIPAPCTLDLCTPCALLVPFVASFSEPICFHIMWIPFPTTSPHLISVRNLVITQPASSLDAAVCFITASLLLQTRQIDTGSGCGGADS